MPSASAATAPTKPRAHVRKSAPVTEVASTPPPSPPTLEQSPPTPPKVNFQNGELTINASNSTLSQVLRAVQLRTGASIDIPAGAGSERVVAQLGPGQPQDVLNTLLNGSKFDYVILGVNGNPGEVQKVILTPKQNGTATSVNSAQNNPPPVADDEPAGDEGTPVADTSENEYQNPDQPPPPPGSFRHPGMSTVQQQQQPSDQNAASGNGDQQNVKTPEQMMQDLQQMQQQQQQYQQQLNPANQNPPQ
jgi:hypothetical protein